MPPRHLKAALTGVKATLGRWGRNALLGSSAGDPAKRQAMGVSRRVMARLFDSIRIGVLDLAGRIVITPLTRDRRAPGQGPSTGGAWSGSSRRCNSPSPEWSKVARGRRPFVRTPVIGDCDLGSGRLRNAPRRVLDQGRPAPALAVP
jgi:hypothetical protein